MFYYNQNNYSNVSYNKPDGTKATVKSGGCGVCSACTVINSLADKELYSVSAMAKFSIENKARTNYGTDMIKLLTALCKKNKGFSFTTSCDVKKLVSHLKSGGMAIVNQGDVYDVFSSAGHFVVADKLDGDNIDILDVGNYSGKYDTKTRKSRIVKKTKNGCVVSQAEIKKATQDRNTDKLPAYYLVSYIPDYKAPKLKKGATYKLTARRGIYKGVGSDTGRKLVKNITLDAKKHVINKNPSAEAVLNTGTLVTVLETKINKSGNLWVRIPSGWLCLWEKKTNKKYYG